MKVCYLNRSTYEKEIQGFSVEQVNHHNGDRTLVASTEANSKPSKDQIIKPEVILLKTNLDTIKIGKETSLTKEELMQTLDFYNDKLNKQTVLLPRYLITRIMNARMYRGNITLETNPELTSVFKQLSEKIGVKVTDIVIQCIDDRNPNGSGHSADFGPKIAGGGVLRYTVATQITSQLLGSIVPHSSTYGFAYHQYYKLGGLAGHTGGEGAMAIEEGNLCKCGCGAVKGLVGYINNHPDQGLGNMTDLMLKLFKYNKSQSGYKPNLLPNFQGEHIGAGAIQFKHHIYDSNTVHKEYLPYSTKSEGIFFIDKNIQRIFVMNEILSLVNTILKTAYMSNEKDKILNLFKGYDIDGKRGQLIINDDNRARLWGKVKKDFVYFDSLVLQQASHNVKAIENVLPKLLVI